MSIVFIVSAPSGSGKSTLVGRLLKEVPNLIFSVSYTTREPRGLERQDESYHFMSRAEFEECIRRDEFLEWAEVFGNYYGTHVSILDRARTEHCDVVLDIDVQGARQLRKRIPEAVSIFILAPSRDILEQRLHDRSEDPTEVIARRLRKAEEEIRNYSAYDYVIVNDEVERSADALASIVKAERIRRTRVEDRIRPILATFEQK